MYNNLLKLRTEVLDVNVIQTLCASCKNNPSRVQISPSFQLKAKSHGKYYYKKNAIGECKSNSLRDVNIPFNIAYNVRIQYTVDDVLT